jgi:hypothetical protein
MYRKRRKSQSYRSASRGRSGGSFKFIFIAVTAIAVVSALITGSVLGKNAEKAEINSFGRHNLTEFGGVRKPAEDYAGLGKLQAAYVFDEGGDRHSFKNSVGEAEGGNAVAFWVNDGAGTLFFASEFFTEEEKLVTEASSVTAEEISDIIFDRGKLSVTLFKVSSFSEGERGARIVKSAEETAILCELAVAGIDEIILFNLPDDSDLSRSVTAYLAGIEAECERANICVALSQTELSGSGATRIINATEGYADAYAADLRGLTVEQLADAVEKYAYYISNYNMRLVVSSGEETDNEAKKELFKTYGIESYIFAD